MFIVSCISCSSDYDTLNVSKVTNYPLIDILGDDPAFVQVGSSYSDPGVNATENGNAIPFSTEYSGDYRGANTLNLNQADRYTASYTATNIDGYSASANRKIYVYKTGNFVDSIEGLYLSTVTRNGSFLPSSQGSSVGMKYVIVWKNSDGTYGMTDAIGGWYDLGRNYGQGYASAGLKFNADLSTLSTSVVQQPNGVGAFGGSITVNNITIDKPNKKLVVSSKWLAPTVYNFIATLTQVN